MRSSVAACLPVAALVSCSPFGNGDVFNCDNDSQCIYQGKAGICAPTPNGNLCAFAGNASECNGGYAIGIHSGDEMGVCLNDAGTVGSGSGRDAGSQSGHDATSMSDGPAPLDARACFGSALPICLDHAPSRNRNLNGVLITGSLVGDGCDMTTDQPDGSKVCVVYGIDVTLGNLTVTGTRPLVIVASGTITVSNDVTAGFSRSSNATGPEANHACNSSQLAGTGIGGGAGGTYGTAGQPGGGTGAGATNTTPTLTAVHGGCHGGKGGSANGGDGGDSGGAIYLLAQTSITITASLTANGAGGGAGKGGPVGGGGGGGGTGGFIGLEAPVITVTGGNTKISAEGGGGGGGGGGGSAKAADGKDGDGGDGNNPASGGDGGPGAGSGGNGGPTPTAGLAPGGAPAGGAGGGGGAGAGVIWTTVAPSDPSKFFPAPTAK